MERIERIGSYVYVVALLCGVMFFASQLQSCAKFNNRIAWSYRALHWSKLAAEVADKGVAVYQRTETARCLKAHGTKTAAYAMCIGKSLNITRRWTGCMKSDGAKYCDGGFAMQIQKAQKGGLQLLETAWAAGKGDIIAAVKPAVCAVAEFLKIAKDGGADFGKADKSISTVLGLASGLCRR